MWLPVTTNIVEAMRDLAAIVLSCLHLLALSVWMGGIMVLGAVAAPAVFGTARRAGDVERGMPLYDFAGTIMTEVFRRFGWAALVAGAVMLAAGLGYGLLARLCRRRLAARAACTGLAWGIAAALTFVLFPRMMEAQAAGRFDLFDGMHRAYSSGFQAQLLLLLGAAALTGWLHLDRSSRREQEGAEGAERAEVGARRGARRAVSPE
jgi:uncharacterized membrane protein